MGGEAAKERRRLKRLQAQNEADGGIEGNKNTTPSLSPKPAETKQTKSNGEKDGEAVRLRLQRKMARKASGQFKPQSSSQSQSDKTPTPTRSNYKRKPEDANDSKSSHPSSRSKEFKKDAPNKNHHSTKKNSAPMRNKNNNSKHKKKDGKQPPAKKKHTQSKHKVKKPKHLKRKMDQLSKTIAEGGDNGDSGGATSIAELEGQMKLLVEQMEKYKQMKQNDTSGDNKVGGQVAVAESKEEAKNDVGEKVDNVQKDAVKTEKENKDSSDDDDSLAEADVKETKSDEKISKEAEESSSSSDSSDDDNSSDDSSSDEDDIVEDTNTRSRGKRRRGRRDAKLVDSSSGVSSKGTDNKEKEIETSVTTSKEKEDVPSNNEANDAPAADCEAKDEKASSKKTSKKDDKRRCIGRKPVTDYSIGKSYQGKVKYIKPKLGAFIDLGCHSDGFCHISNVSNDFVSSVTDALKVGDDVNVRVIEINREKKRMSVSLRSEDMAQNEQERLKTTRQYEDGMMAKKKTFNNNNGHARKFQPKKEEGHVRFDAGGDSKSTADQYSKNNATSSMTVDFKREMKLARRAERRAQKEEQQMESSGTNGFSGEQHWGATRETQKSGADMKRERKIARRAERRAAREASENGNALQ